MSTTVINTNLTALSVQRFLNALNFEQTETFRRLATGVKINSGADDASGMAISTKMRSQIIALDRAQQNAQDGISLVQIADGGLNGINDLVNRVRELAVQSANETNDPQDRDKMQLEVNQLVTEIDYVTERTQFNNRRLLDGSGSYISPTFSNGVLGTPDSGDGTTMGELQSKILQYLEGTWLNDAARAIQERTGLAFNENIKLTVAFEPVAGSAVAYMASSPNNTDYKLVINSNFLKNALNSEFDPTSSGSGPEAGGMLLDRVLTHEMMHGIMNNQIGSDDLGKLPEWFAEGLAEAVHGASYRYSDFETSQSIAQAKSDLSKSAPPANGSYESYSSGYLFVQYLDHYDGTKGGGKIAELLNNIKTQSFHEAVKSTFGNDRTVNTLWNEMQEKIGTTDQEFLDFLSDHMGISAGGNYGLSGGSYSDADAVPNASTPSSETPTGKKDFNLNGVSIMVIWPTIHSPETTNFANGGTPPNQVINRALPVSGPGLMLQVGANAGQMMNIGIGTVNASTLLGSGVDITTAQNANNAIGQIDNGLNYLSMERAKIGAYQTRLEQITTSLASFSLNTSDANSRIKDADMAKEMVRHSSNNVLATASMMVLALSNRQVGSVMRLLETDSSEGTSSSPEPAETETVPAHKN